MQLWEGRGSMAQDSNRQCKEETQQPPVQGRPTAALTLPPYLHEHAQHMLHGLQGEELLVLDGVPLVNVLQDHARVRVHLGAARGRGGNEPGGW